MPSLPMDSQLPLTQSHDSCWLMLDDYLTMAPSSLPTSMTGTFRSSQSVARPGLCVHPINQS